MSATYSAEDIKRCTLTGRRDILFQIRSLIRQNPRVSVAFDNGKHTFLSVLIEVSADETLLFFDRGGSEKLNRVFLQTERCQFLGDTNGIRIQFITSKPQLKRLPSGEEVFAVPMPASMLRLQRRDAFRLSLHSAKPYFCCFNTTVPNQNRLAISDISIGGVGFTLTSRPSFESMQQIEKNTIDLREFGVLQVALEIRYVFPGKNRQKKPVWYMGCRFVKLSSSAENAIQRFMAKIEVERRALSAG